MIREALKIANGHIQSLTHVGNETCSANAALQACPVRPFHDFPFSPNIHLAGAQQNHSCVSNVANSSPPQSEASCMRLSILLNCNLALAALLISLNAKGTKVSQSSGADDFTSAD
jgi:hypothetical protein